MRTYKHLMAIALIALASSAGIQTTKAQEQENFVWITNTNGITEKRVMTKNSHIYFFSDREKHETAQIVVPEHASIASIDMRGGVNVTNLIFRPTTAKQWHSNSFYPDGGQYIPTDKLSISPTPSLRTIAMRPEMMRKTDISGVIWTGREREYSTTFPAWLLMIEWTTNWQAGDPPKMEIRTITTNNGNEVEVIWRAGTIQIADALNGKWRDHSGSSPLRFPLTNPFAYPKDMQFFRIKPEEEEEPDPEDNQGTPPQPEK